MKLRKIVVENFRCIEKATLILNEIGDGSHTYTLIGVNESGKSSFLEAVSKIHEKKGLDSTEKKNEREGHNCKADIHMEKK